MKKEIFATAILLLLAAVSIWNAYHAQKLTSELCDMLNASLEMAESEQWQKAAALAEAASESWEAAETYTKIFIGHNSIDLTTDAFGDYLGELYRSDMGGVRGAHLKLLAHINAIYEMERISLTSIF